ncbi:hypothetical protein D9619_004233 [Psilocybe cf. subviscida]|uniref:Uncharacterized protein n=1 Tax=Psilocybe cf. subviscida TaxID=2480587 RepID=A0A8H5BNU6_9AGAR|nr:hypothetical protein D9619_004233 [Psilocybe cf. subviscida]
MYNGYGSTSPPLTNNPFITDAGHQVSARFPDLSAAAQQGPDPQQQYGQQQQQWGNGMTGGGYPQQQGGMYQQQQPQMGYGQQQPQQQMNGGYLSPNLQQQTPYSTSTPGSIGGKFQPSSSFGQQLAAHVSGSSYGYLNGQQPQPNSTAYTPAQQQLQSPGYVAQFDPYSSLGQAGWDGGNNGPGGGMGMGMGNGNGNMQQQQQQQQQQGYFGGGGAQPSGHTSNPSMGYGLSILGEPHPKDFIRTHKAAIEAWDQFTWKQWITSFEALMRAWDQRKAELRQRIGELTQQMSSIGGYDYQGVLPRIQQEAGRLQGLIKEAENNHDSVAASVFQMKEVQEGYRQSSDLAGKRRVKEATNAALQGLPGWPQPY